MARNTRVYLGFPFGCSFGAFARRPSTCSVLLTTAVVCFFTDAQLLYGPDKLPILRSHTRKIVIASYTSNVPQHDINNGSFPITLNPPLNTPKKDHD